MKSLLLVLGTTLILAGCASVGIEDYANEEPELNLLEYFSGPVEAWGMFQNRSGKVVTRFHVQIESRREGDRLILDEHFTYSDGTLQRRVWTLTPDGPKGWRGTADDVVGEAQGQLAGNAFRWQYRLSLPVDGRIWEVNFDDWMYLMDQDTLINRASMRKFGIEWGQVTLFFRRQ